MKKKLVLIGLLIIKLILIGLLIVQSEIGFSIYSYPGFMYFKLYFTMMCKKCKQTQNLILLWR